MPQIARRVLGGVLIVVLGLASEEALGRGNGRGGGRSGGAPGGGEKGTAAGDALRGRGAGPNVGSASGRLGLPPSLGPFSERRWNPGPWTPPGGYAPQAPRTAASFPPVNRSPLPTSPIAARAAPPPPAPTSAASRPTSPTPTIAPATYRESAAAHLYALANAAAWNMYDNYTDSPTYASTYREMHKLVVALKSLAADIRGSKPGSASEEALAARLQEADWRLTAIQAEVAAWPSEGKTPRSPDRDLRTQLDRLRGALTGLLADFGVSPEAPATIPEEEAGETIRPRRPAADGPQLAPTPLDDPPQQ